MYKRAAFVASGNNKRGCGNDSKMQPLLQSLSRQEIRFQIIRRYSSVLRCRKAPFCIPVQMCGFLEMSSFLLSYF